MSDQLDIYGDLENYNAKQILNEKSDEIKILQEKYTLSIETINDLQNTNNGLQKQIRNIEKSFYSLLETAKLEISRKDRMISELRQELDDIKFRRFNHRNVDRIEERRAVANSLPQNKTSQYASSSSKKDIHQDEKFNKRDSNTKRKDISYTDSKANYDGARNETAQTNKAGGTCKVAESSKNKNTSQKDTPKWVKNYQPECIKQTSDSVITNSKNKKRANHSLIPCKIKEDVKKIKNREISSDTAKDSKEVVLTTKPIEKIAQNFEDLLFDEMLSEKGLLTLKTDEKIELYKDLEKNSSKENINNNETETINTLLPLNEPNTVESILNSNGVLSLLDNKNSKSNDFVSNQPEKNTTFINNSEDNKLSLLCREKIDTIIVEEGDFQTSQKKEKICQMEQICNAQRDKVDLCRTSKTCQISDITHTEASNIQADQSNKISEDSGTADSLTAGATKSKDDKETSESDKTHLEDASSSNLVEGPKVKVEITKPNKTSFAVKRKPEKLMGHKINGFEPKYNEKQIKEAFILKKSLFKEVINENYLSNNEDKNSEVDIQICSESSPNSLDTTNVTENTINVTNDGDKSFEEINETIEDKCSPVQQSINTEKSGHQSIPTEKSNIYSIYNDEKKNTNIETEGIENNKPIDNKPQIVKDIEATFKQMFSTTLNPNESEKNVDKLCAEESLSHENISTERVSKKQQNNTLIEDEALPNDGKIEKSHCIKINILQNIQIAPPTTDLENELDQKQTEEEETSSEILGNNQIHLSRDIKPEILKPDVKKILPLMGNSLEVNKAATDELVKILGSIPNTLKTPSKLNAPLLKIEESDRLLHNEVPSKASATNSETSPYQFETLEATKYLTDNFLINGENSPLKNRIKQLFGDSPLSHQTYESNDNEVNDKFNCKEKYCDEWKVSTCDDLKKAASKKVEKTATRKSTRNRLKLQKSNNRIQAADDELESTQNLKKYDKKHPNGSAYKLEEEIQSSLKNIEQGDEQNSVKTRELLLKLVRIGKEQKKTNLINSYNSEAIASNIYELNEEKENSKNLDNNVKSASEINHIGKTETANFFSQEIGNEDRCITSKLETSYDSINRSDFVQKQIDDIFGKSPFNTECGQTSYVTLDSLSERRENLSEKSINRSLEFNSSTDSLKTLSTSSKNYEMQLENDGTPIWNITRKRKRKPKMEEPSAESSKKLKADSQCTNFSNQKNLLQSINLPQNGNISDNVTKKNLSSFKIPKRKPDITKNIPNNSPGDKSDNPGTRKNLLTKRILDSQLDESTQNVFLSISTDAETTAETFEVSLNEIDQIEQHFKHPRERQEISNQNCDNDIEEEFVRIFGKSPNIKPEIKHIIFESDNINEDKSCAKQKALTTNNNCNLVNNTCNEMNLSSISQKESTFSKTKKYFVTSTKAYEMQCDETDGPIWIIKRKKKKKSKVNQ